MIKKQKRKQKGGNSKQYIDQLQDTEIFPNYNADCIFIKNNDFIKELPIFPDTIKYIYIENNPQLKELHDDQFSDNLGELHIEYMSQLTKIYIPEYLSRLTIGNMPFTLFRTLLPEFLVTLTITNCSMVNFDYDELPDDLFSLELSNNTFTHFPNIVSILRIYKKNHPDCYIETDFIFLPIPSKFVDLITAYDIIDLEERQITHFLANNKNFIVGKCYDQFIFIDKIRLDNISKELFKLSTLGFAINNSYIDYKFIEYILDSKHKYWLFEKIDGQFTVNGEKSTLFTLIKLKNANSLRENVIRKYIRKTLKKKNHINTTRKAI
jgi:hypothetical protein